MIIIRTWFARALFHALFFVMLSAIAQEGIERFDAVITVNADGSLDVQETIRVNAQNQQINRGIIREFPTTYSEGSGFRYRVPFVVKRVLRDDKPESYAIESRNNGQAVRIGNKETMLTRGQHTFVIEYHTDRQIGFFKDHDELYWNVNGNGWRLPIGQVTAQVKLPVALAADQVDFTAYTGPQGARGTHFKAGRMDDGLIWFTSTRPFSTFEGLTIAVKWPKGIVREPTAAERRRNFLYDNLALIWALFGILILTAYCIVRGIKLCRVNAIGTVIPLFHPPAGISPAQAGALSRERYSDELFAAQVVQLAVKGYVDIESKEKPFKDRIFAWWSDVPHIYVLKKKEGTQSLTPDEQSLYVRLFGVGCDTVILDGKDDHRQYVRGAQLDLHARVVQWLQRYFDKHTLDVGIASAIAAAVFLPCMFFWVSTIGTADIGLYFMVAIAGFVPYLLTQTVNHAVFFILFFGIALIVQNAFVLLVIVVSFIVWIFAYVVRGYTAEGSQIAKQIEGFKLFLMAAEVPRMQYVGTPPVRTPELYETCLPYAIALGVEKEWTRQFSAVFEAYAQSGKEYAPVWYTGPRSYLYAGRMGGDMRSAVASTARTPVSSSEGRPGSGTGFGRGGRSGGGGGGGGGGGW